MSTSTYQKGELNLRKRKNSPDIYEFRYRKYNTDGSYTKERERLGTVKELPTKKLLEEKLAEVRERINNAPRGILFSDVATRFKKEHITTLRPHTQTTDLANLRYLELKFSGRPMSTIEPGELDAYINSLKSIKNPREELSKNTRKHVKALAHNLWRQAMLWGYLNAAVNPVEIVRVTKGARQKRKAVPSVELYFALLDDEELLLIVKVMLQIATFCGPRISEILGLLWEDVDLKNGILHIRRSAVGKHTALTKNESSERDIPLPEFLVEALIDWKKAGPVWGGWVFGSPITKRPYHAGIMQQDHLRAAGARLGFEGSLGWHSFRHKANSLLMLAGVSREERKKIMGHSTDQMSDFYGSNDPELIGMRRQAQDKVVEMMQTKRKTGTNG